MPTNKVNLGGWKASDFGQETGKCIEYRVYEIHTDRGGKFLSFDMFKPFQYKQDNPKTGTMAGEWGKGFSFPLEAHAEIVQRLNHMINTYLRIPGAYQFVAQGAQQVAPPQQFAQPPVNQGGFNAPAAGSYGQPAPLGYNPPVQQPAFPQGPTQRNFGGID